MSFSPINTVKTAMPEVNPASFIISQDNGSWLGRIAQPIKNHPVLFAITAVVIGIIGYVGYTIYKAMSNNGSNVSNGDDDDFKINPKNVQNNKPNNNTQKKSDIETLIDKTNSQINLSSKVAIEKAESMTNDYKQMLLNDINILKRTVVDYDVNIMRIANDTTKSCQMRTSVVENITKAKEIAQRQLDEKMEKLKNIEAGGIIG